MNITDILTETHDLYAKKAIASVRADIGSPVEYVGMMHIKGESSRRVGLVVVWTSAPASTLTIVKENANTLKGEISAEALEELAAISSFHNGRACLMWVNAGRPAVMAGPALANVWQTYELSTEREERKQSWPATSRVIAWDHFKPIDFIKPRKKIIVDWLGACVNVPEEELKPPVAEED